MTTAILSYLLWAALIAAVFIYAVRRAYLRGHDDGWNDCTEELAIDANQADDAVQQHDATVRSYVLPILQRRPDTRELPLHTLDTEHLLRLLDNSERSTKA